MRERAAEVGGSCSVEPGPVGGVRVCASLPLMTTHGRFEDREE
jgi:signal transduction histidine kinase